ncbi:MAG TPA: PRC-barrel domain-containing protein, partial [Anaerolineales bacterium]|nr:PRC-barrel domain-containing protein [Anaerolineales bacterium]
MRKFSLLLSTLLVVSLLLAACGAEETSTTVPSTNVPPVTVESTMTGEATSETPDADLTTTPAVPVTGEDDPSRLSNLLDFDVWNQNGEQIGEVDDMVLDLDNINISYVIVGTGGFLDLGEKDILIPWNSLELQTTATGGQENAFILLEDPEMLTNAPDFDVDANLPGMGQPATDWDADIRNFWESGVVPEAQATPAADTTATAVPEMTATTTTDSATATGPDAGTGTGQADKLQGVMLASELLGSSLTIGNQGGEGQGVGQATLAPEATATTDAATAMPDATATASTGTGAGTGTGTGGPTSA